MKGRTPKPEALGIYLGFLALYAGGIVAGVVFVEAIDSSHFIGATKPWLWSLYLGFQLVALVGGSILCRHARWWLSSGVGALAGFGQIVLPSALPGVGP